MRRRFLIGVLVGLVLAAALACSTDVKPASPSAPAVTSTLADSVDSMVGDYTFDVPAGLADSDPAISGSTSSCGSVEFHVTRDTDSKTAKIVFAARCARARLRGEGVGLLSSGILFWKAAGKALLPDGSTCDFRFAEGNKAALTDAGQIRVTYHGTVCDHPVSGTTIVRRK